METVAIIIIHVYISCGLQVCGIGKVTEKMLNAIGVENCCDLYEKRGVLKLLFSENAVQNFFQIALGISSTDVNK